MDFYYLWQLWYAGLYSLKATSRTVVQKSNDDKIVKPDENPRNTEEIIIPQRDEILWWNKSRKVL